MSDFTLSNTVDKDKVFLVNLSEITERLDPYFYHEEFTENLNRIYSSKYTINKFREVIKEFKGGPMGFHLHTYDYRLTGIPVLRIGNLKDIYLSKNQDFIFISEDKHNELKSSKVKPNDLIFSKAGKVGEMSIIPSDFGEANLNQALSRITLCNNVIPEYVLLFFKSNLGKLQIYRYGGGRAVQDDLKMSEIEHFKIIVPDFKTQIEIVEKYKIALAQNQQKEAEAKKLLASIDEYLLNELGITLPEKDNSLQNRIFKTSISKVSGNRYDCDYYSGYYTLLENAIAKSKYITDKIDTIVTNIAGGKTPASTEYSKEKTNYPTIKVGSYTKEFINLSKADYTISPNILKAKKGDIYILSAAHQAEYVGRHIKYLNDEPEISTSYVGELICVRTDQAKGNSMYLFSLLNTEIMKTLINREKTGQTSHIYGKDIKHIKIPLPPIKKQNEIAEYITKTRNKAKQLQKEAVTELEKAKQEVEKMILQTDKQTG